MRMIFCRIRDSVSPNGREHFWRIPPISNPRFSNWSRVRDRAGASEKGRFIAAKHEDTSQRSSKRREGCCAVCANGRRSRRSRKSGIRTTSRSGCCGRCGRAAAARCSATGLLRKSGIRTTSRSSCCCWAAAARCSATGLQKTRLCSFPPKDATP